MMSSRPETSPHASGAHPARRNARNRGRVPRGAHLSTTAQQPPTRYDPYLDGLFTYCLSVLCDHDEATAALADALVLAERRGSRGSQAPGGRRAWLYALARWSCLRRLAEARRRRQPGGHAAGRDRGPRAHKEAADRRAAEAAAAVPLSEETQEERRRELARLAWPEAAGTTPEQREALELAVRHQLSASEVAAVLGMEPAAARELLASAACEVERTRAALAVVETGVCPSAARLTGDHQLVLSATLRRELVRHVDDCPRCRRAAERAVPGSWPGTSVTPAELPVLKVPRKVLQSAMAHAAPTRGGVPRFDRRGFPVDPKDHAARRDRLRARAVTTTVVAAVIAAPVLALWAAYRGPLAGDSAEGPSATAREAHGSETLGGDGAGGYENAGNASAKPGGHFGKDGRSPDVSVEVIGVKTGNPGSGHLGVVARNDGTTTLITLTASGDGPVHWSVSTRASWLYMNQSSGTLAPGESFTVRVYVDHLREPSGSWHASVAVAPAGAVVTIDGYGAVRPTEPHPTPDQSGPSDPAPSGSPSADPDPTPSDPTPTDPPSTSGPPSDPPSPTSTLTDSFTASPSP
ncbi:BACON domain-containing protein [Streptomyces sp. CA-106131]|uniref:BACON domain-containing protein n=1 Tax=Streptomyces sp. CA-106131 TaxID=3240045 RepID=UPI003D905D29